MLDGVVGLRKHAGEALENVGHVCPDLERGVDAGGVGSFDQTDAVAADALGVLHAVAHRTAPAAAGQATSSTASQAWLVRPTGVHPANARTSRWRWD